MCNVTEQQNEDITVVLNLQGFPGR